jgi:hypothetical protein
MTISHSEQDMYRVVVYREGEGFMLAVEVPPPRRWWHVWRPTRVYVPLTKTQVIWLYQTIHKVMVSAFE